ncbi:hypothetical protein K7X08_007277 [Anisodus acutangulus]|uniref:Uncharacterized protein n=1 Tax=Anisodus acutangulus TaxID=402998 RepID=A0A9Q1LFI5_9SOLA|nr:hypothetical protein K7X08_007277 [Anisodus acutangulus]
MSEAIWKAAGDAGPIMIRLTRVVKAPESEVGGCIVCRTPDFSVAKFDDRTVMLCGQNCVLKGAEVIPAPAAVAVTKKHVQKCLTDAATNDIQWRIIPKHLPLLSSAATIFRECFDPIVSKSGRDLIPVMVYGRNISGQEFGGMYCIILIVKVISRRIEILLSSMRVKNLVLPAAEEAESI